MQMCSGVSLSPPFVTPLVAHFHPPGQQDGFDGGFSPRLELGIKPGLTFAAPGWGFSTKAHLY